VFLDFTTANRVPRDSEDDILPHRVINERRLDLLFLATAEATQESVYDALAAADTTTGRPGHMLPGLRHALGRRL
jgi:D-aminopeptidase